MNKALIIFGSKTDEKVYKEIAAELKKQKVDFDLRISSAHKTPDDVDTTLKNDYSVVIAGWIGRASSRSCRCKGHKAGDWSALRGKLSRLGCAAFNSANASWNSCSCCWSKPRQNSCAKLREDDEKI